MNQPSIFIRILDWLLSIFQPRPAPPPVQIPGTPPPVEEGPAPVTRKVSLVIYNPLIPGTSNQRLTDVLRWNDPNRMADQLVADLREISHGYANFEVVERLVLDTFPLKQDGFRYTAEEFLDCWRAGRGFHNPDAVDYDEVVRENDLVAKVQTGLIDEVWTISFPYAGFFESRMAGPHSFWCNGPAFESADPAGRRFVIMAFNYERGVGEMLESMGHRAESIMERVFRNVSEEENLWKRFTLYDKIAPGQAEIGNVHFAPNSLRDYDWGNPSPVPTRCRNWKNFPDLSGDPVVLDCREWGGGDIRAHHRWWFDLMPHINGFYNDISFNWWEYIVDPNRVM